MPSSGRTPSPPTVSANHANSNGNHHARLERQRVTSFQRARMLAAAAGVAAEQGVGNVTVTQVVERAGVSRRTFYEIFEDSRDCLLAVFDEALMRACERVLPAYRIEDRWRARLRAGLQALLEFLEEEPHLGWLLIVGSLGSAAMLERRSRVVAQLVAAVGQGEAERLSGGATGRLTAEGVVGAVLSVIHGRLVKSPRPRLLELLNPLMGMVVMPYLGAGAARRELARPVLATPPPERGGASSPLRGLGMRLTYRTVLVLAAIAAEPGSSNRRIGEAAGMSDQGQVSKLLARLEKLELIENASAGHAPGERNAWALTSRGEEVHGAIDRRVAHA